MDLTRYSELKLKGTVAVRKYGATVGVEVNQFDNETGDAMPPQFQVLSIQQLKDTVSQYQRGITELSTLIADLEALG